MSAPLKVAEEIAKSLPVTDRRRPTKMALYLARKMSVAGTDKAVVPKE
jgi:hypothetical protein